MLAQAASFASGLIGALSTSPTFLSDLFPSLIPLISMATFGALLLLARGWLSDRLAPPAAPAGGVDPEQLLGSLAAAIGLYFLVTSIVSLLTAEVAHHQLVSMAQQEVGGLFDADSDTNLVRARVQAAAYFCFGVALFAGSDAIVAAWAAFRAAGRKRRPSNPPAA
jgi:hypothetical protein